MVPWLWGYQSIFWHCEQVLIVVLALLYRPLASGSLRSSTPSRYSCFGSADRILALLAVFDDRPSIPVFIYLFGDGFLTSSGDIAPAAFVRFGLHVPTVGLHN
jgi:hypothetical protein